MLLPMRIKTSILLVLVLCVLAYALQASAQALPGIGTVNHLVVDVIKVTTNPTDPKDTADINGPVGGDSVSIYVKVQYGNVITNINLVTVNIHESGVSTVVGTLSLTAYTQLADSGSGDATLHTRVYTGTWNTLTTTPLIYNNEYCFNATVDYDRNNAHASPAVDSVEVIVPVKNLWITSANPSDAFFTLESGATKKITVNFDHYMTTADYTVQFSIRNTWDNTTIIPTDPIHVTGHSASIDWIAATQAFPYGGYFCFDISITCGNDIITYCSPTCTVISDAVNCPDDTTVRFTYALSEQPDAGSISVCVYNELDPKGTQTGLSAQSATVDISVPSGLSGARPVITGRDNHTDNRGKTRQQFLPRNLNISYKIRYALYFKLTNDHVNDSNLYIWRRILNLPEGKNEYLEYRGPDDDFRSYPANSGGSNGTTINSDDRGDTWTVGGPQPAFNTIYENYLAADTVFRPSIMTFTLFGRHNYTRLDDQVTEVQHTMDVAWSNFLWRADNTTTENYDGTIVHKIYRRVVGDTIYYSNIRYHIFNKSSQNTFHEYVNGQKGGTLRNDFAIHEDTNKAHRGGHYDNGTVPGPEAKGSAGCIALIPGQMKSFYSFIQDRIVNRPIVSTWYNSNSQTTVSSIPVYVLNDDTVPNTEIDECISCVDRLLRFDEGAD